MKNYKYTFHLEIFTRGDAYICIYIHFITKTLNIMSMEKI